MTRIMLHPVFLELISSNSLLDRISRRKLSGLEEPGPANTSDTNPIWLSEDDLCNMWKVVLKSKLYKQPNGFRMENLAWRLWFYARRKNSTDPMPVSSVRIERPFGLLESPVSDWSPKDIPSRLTKHHSLGFMPAAVSRSSVTVTGQAESRHISSKSFVALHDFSLLTLGASDPSEESEEEPLDTRILDPNTNNVGKSKGALLRRHSSRKKKDVDKYLQQQLIIDDEKKQRPLEIFEPKSSSSTELDVIKPSPDMKRVGVPARKISRGFSIPTKKSGSSISAESPKFALSSVSSDDALNLFDKESSLRRPNINVPSASYKQRRPSFSRSASPNISRAPVSMLTILMNGQLTMTDGPSQSHLSPPSRPSAPVNMCNAAQESIPEETEASFGSNHGLVELKTTQPPEDRRPRSRSGKSPTQTSPTHHKDIHPALSIW